MVESNVTIEFTVAQLQIALYAVIRLTTCMRGRCLMIEYESKISTIRNVLCSASCSTVRSVTCVANDIS